MVGRLVVSQPSVRWEGAKLLSSLAGWLAGLLEPVPFHSTLFTSFLFHSRGFWVLFLYIHFYLHSFSSVFVHAGSTVFFLFLHTVEYACVGSALNSFLLFISICAIYSFLSFVFLLFHLRVGLVVAGALRRPICVVGFILLRPEFEVGGEIPACRILLGLGVGRLIWALGFGRKRKDFGGLEGRRRASG